VAHGALEIRTYLSTPLKKLRKLLRLHAARVRQRAGQRFPVLYLRHGSGDTEENWSNTGRAGTILDNLIAQHKAVPMIVVMPNGDTDGTWAGGSSPEASNFSARNCWPISFHDREDFSRGARP